MAAPARHSWTGEGRVPPVARDALAADPVLAETVRRLVTALQPTRIYLFGSEARGDEGPDSDYDILVLVEHPTEPLYRLSHGDSGRCAG